MSTTASLQNLAAKPKALSHSTHAGLLLQRKCACGSPTSSLTGECAECKSNKLLQTKLTIGASNDPLEQEADRVADQVLAAPANPAVSSAPPHIQRFRGQSTGLAGTAPASIDRVLASTGRPLDPALRQDMGQHFGHDFANVRVHADAAAEQSARDVNAHAYTVGHDIVFGAGQFAPGTHEGRRLIAHEMTHVVQQSGADGMNVGQNNDKRGLSSIAPGLQRKPVINGKDSFHEKAAPDIDKAIAASFITTYVPQKDLKPLKGNMEVLIPTDYEDAYKRWGGSKKDSFEIPGYTDRTAKKKPIKLRTMGRDYEGRNVRPSTVEAAVHETVHLNSQMQFQTNFPHNYNEGVTQYFTEKILGGAGAAYPDEIKLAQGLIKALGSGGEDLVAKAYFKGDKEPYATILRGFMQDPNHLHKHEWEVAAEKDPTDLKTANTLLEDALKFANNPTTSPPPAPPPAPAQSPSPPAVQKKLAINQPGDQFEQEADRVADQVMAAPAHPVVSGTPPRIQRFSGQSNGQMIAAPASVDRVLASPGRPLEPALRQDMGQRFGHDFSRVRVHSGAAAEQSARDVNAHAYTAGHDIVFGTGRFAPGIHEGRWLLAHELTHVIQQGDSGSGNGARVIHRKTDPKGAAYKDCTEATTTITSPQRELAPALARARAFVDGAICVLDRDPAGESKDSSYRIAQERHFLGPTKALRMGLKNNFQAILEKLTPQNIRCAAADADQTYCASSTDASHMAAFMRGGESFLCYNFWALNRNCKAITLVHEAAHAAGFGMSAKHPPYRGSAEYPLGGAPAGKSETAAVRSGNPDAYGYFAAHVWRDIDTECRAINEIIEVTGSAPKPAVSGESKEGK